MSLRGAKRRGNLPEGIPCYKPTQDTEKGAHKQKSEHYLPDNAISKVQLSGTPRDTCTRGEKAHTSKRVSIIARDNAISKVQCAPWGNDNTTAVAVVLSFDVF